MTKKVALVTGGSGGLGSAMCKQLSDSGYTVAVTYRSQDCFLNWQNETQNHTVQGFPCDVSNWEDCLSLKDAITEKLGQVDILVNNAGITADATFKKMTPEMWNAVINTNLNSMFYVSKQFVEDMMSRGFGRVINISSVNGQKGQFGQTNYSAAKSGVYGFTKALAQETVRKGVTVNAISPGYIRTKMVDGISEEVQAKICATIPVGRFGNPEEIARMVVFLASEESGYITGANFSVNGGLYMD